MSEKRYPTRMHEVLGVETGQVFYFEGANGLYQEYVLDGKGHLFRNHKTQRIESPRMMADIINHPERIVRKPRLSEEQVKQLRALVTLGFRWLIKNRDCSAFAYTYMPEKMDAWWEGANADVQIFIDLPTGVLYDLVSWSDPEPLNIVQTLRDAGVEVEE